MPLLDLFSVGEVVPLAATHLRLEGFLRRLTRTHVNHKSLHAAAERVKVINLQKGGGGGREEQGEKRGRCISRLTRNKCSLSH